MIADECRTETLRREQAGEKAHRRAGVSAVDDLPGHLQSAESDASDLGGPLAERDRNAHLAERIRSREIVETAREAGHSTRATRERSEQDRSMTDRLVAGHPNRSAKGTT